MKSATKIAALGIGLGLAAGGCGSGTVVIAMVSPTITQVSPQVVTAGTPSVTVTVQGSNFQSQAAVTVNGTVMPTTVVNATTLAAKISGSTLAQPAVAHLQVKNTDGASSNEVPLTVTSPSQNSTLAISTTGLPGAQSGTSYTTALSASGGTPGYTWSLTSGSLPAGLNLSSGGVISGKPTTSGTSSFAVTVSDSSSPAQTQTVTLSIVVLPVTTSPSTLAVASAALGGGQVGTAYNSSLSATGGTPGYSWSLASGSLPAGLALSSGGTISGTPTSNGTSTFTVAVTDSGSPAQSASGQVSITVAGGALAVHSVSLGAGMVGNSYSTTLTATGGTPGYTWSLSSGSLPGGLTLSSSGTISGTPKSAGTASFTVTVADSESPTQTASALESLTIASSNLAVTSTTLSSGKQGSSYSATLNASGGTPGYTWSLASGSLPAGLTLSSAGVISGTPTASGNANFTVSVSDNGSPVQTASASESIGVASNALTITSTALIGGTSGTAYNSTLSATGGSPAYTWAMQSGALPSGLTLSSAGVILGTPTATGSFSITVSVSDSESPVQTQTATLSINIAAASSGTQNTWYVRPDGGTRYSSNVTTGQCDGLGDQPYPGSGTNQHCAFSDVRYFWTDGSYCVDASATSTCWTWIGKSGDTYLIRGSIATGVTYRIGQNGPNLTDYFGLAGDPYGAGIPPPISGTSSAHTKILGENFANCSAQSSRTQLHGGYGVSSVIDMVGVSYVDLQCLDITDFSSCGRSAQLTVCNTNYPISDYATNGIVWSNTSTNDTLTNIRVHGLSSAGMLGPTGDGVVMTGLDIIGNAAAGWNADAGDGTTGTGNLLVQNFSIQWNGCAEEYPIVDAQPYQDCTDDNIGGYGDGFGTATVSSNPGWRVHFDQGLVIYNTQDGLDALHLRGNGSSMTITRVLAYGNMGQQIKVGGAQGAAINNVIFTNCNAMRQAIPGTPSGYNSRLSDFCRAADSGIAMTVGKGSLLSFDFNTVYSASATGVEIDCDPTYGPCDSTSLVDYRNNIFIGFLNNSADGYPSGGTGDYSNPIYVGVLDQGYTNPFANAGSVMSNNITYHGKSSWSCPATWLNELNAICSDPNLTDETWHVYGYGNATPAPSTTVVQGAGVNIPSVTVDYTGAARGNPPSIGAYE